MCFVYCFPLLQIKILYCCSELVPDTLDSMVRYASPFVQQCVQSLQDGAKPSVVMKRIRSRYSTPCTRRNRISDMRLVLSHNTPSLLKKLDGDLRMTKDEARMCKISQKKSREARLSVAPKIDGAVVLKHCELVLHACDHVPIYELALCLLAVTGRRTTELLNGRSSITKVPSKSHECTFAGQLKNDAKRPYRIPLLMPFTLTARAWNALQRRQPDDTPRLTNAEISARYQSGLRAHMSDENNVVWHSFRNVHDLRSFYACAAFACFDAGDVSAQKFTQCILGHARLHEAAVYNAFRITLADADMKLPFDTFAVT